MRNASSGNAVTGWTPDLKKIAADHYLMGRSPEWIAAELGAPSADAVKMVLSRMGVHRGPPPSSKRSTRPRHPDERADLASRIAALLGEAPLPAVPRAEIPDEDLLRYTGRAGWSPEDTAELRSTCARWLLSAPSPLGDDALARVLGLRAFGSEVCRLDLDGPQLAMAAAVLGSKRAVVLAGRRSGKSVALGAVATWSAVCTPNAHVVMVAAADRQAKEVAERVVFPLFAQDDRLFASIRSSNKELVELRNGSLIRFLPATGQIRGIGASLLLVDEARDVQNEELVYASIEPFLANTNGSMAVFSTPWMSSGKLWDSWHSPFYAKVRVPSWDSRFVSAEHVGAERLQMSAQVFGAEFGAEFMESVAGYLSSESLSKCLRSCVLSEAREEGRVYGLGVDFGRYRDASAFVVVSKGEDARLRVDWVRAFTNVPLSDQRPYVGYLDTRFGFERVVAESAGLGIQISEEIASDLRGRVELFRPTLESKARAFEYLKGVVERGELDLPLDPPQLVAQLRSLQFEVRANGISIHGAHGSADDLAHALTYAVWALRRPRGRPGFARMRWPGADESAAPLLSR